MNFGLKALWQAVVHIEATDVFEVNQVSAVFDVITNVDISNAHHAVEGRDQPHALQARTRQTKLCISHLQGCGAFIQRALGQKVLSDQLLVALVIGLGYRQLGQCLLHFRTLQGVIHLNQYLTCPHTRAISKT